MRVEFKYNNKFVFKKFVISKYAEIMTIMKLWKYDDFRVVIDITFFNVNYFNM